MNFKNKKWVGMANAIGWLAGSFVGLRVHFVSYTVTVIPLISSSFLMISPISSYS
jgi:hypothetical protein